MKSHQSSGYPAPLPVEVDALLRRLPQQPSDIVEITALRGRTQDRGYAFRVTFPSGTRIKARRFPPGFDCETLRQTLTCLPTDRFAQIRANNSRASLEDWVEGPTLDAVPCTKPLLVASGHFLVDIHHAVPLEFPDGDVLDRYGHTLEANLMSLREVGLLDRSVVRDVAAFVSRNAPQRCIQGLTHQDFCGANLVLKGRTIVAIDNVTMRVSALDEDLARTWYRWPLGESEWRTFLRGYSEKRDVDSYLSHERFWRALALIHAAAVRLRVVGLAAAEPPLGRLLALVGRSNQRTAPAQTRAA